MTSKHKKSAVEYYLVGDKSRLEVCEIFKCSKRSLIRWFEKESEIKRQNRKYKVCKENVKFLLYEIKNELMLKLKEKFDVSLSRFHINDNNITLKIRHEQVKLFGKDIPNNFDSMLDFIINILSIEERQLIIKRNLQKKLIINFHESSKKLFLCMALMTGSYIWNGNPIVFRKWLFTDESIQLSNTSNICCYEAILYAAWLAGLTTKIQLRKILFFKCENMMDQTILINSRFPIICSKYGIINNIQNRKKIIYYSEMDNLYISLGCEIKTTLDENNKIQYDKLNEYINQDNVKICYDMSLTESKPDHSYLLYKNYILEINCNTICRISKQMMFKKKISGLLPIPKSPVQIQDFKKSINKKNKLVIDSFGKFIDFTSYFGNINYFLKTIR